MESFSKYYNRFKDLVAPWLGVIHQRRPSKNWLFGHPPPCPTSFVWKTPPPPPPRPRTSRPYRAKTQHISSETQGSGRTCTRGGGLRKRKIFAQNLQRWMSCLGAFPPPSSEVVHFCMTPPLSGQTSLMDGPLNMVIIIIINSLYFIIDMKWWRRC